MNDNEEPALDDENVRDASKKIGLLMADEGVPYPVAIKAIAILMMEIATLGCGWDEPQAREMLAALFSSREVGFTGSSH